MPRYDFASLSSHDFEELIRDLLQAEWQVHVEAFKAGRDSGIDLRYAPAHQGSTIVQCKHFLGSGYSKLLHHLRDVEFSKIRRLSPQRYVVATTVALSPQNKEEISRSLSPYILSTSDILGAGDVDGLLSRHPDIEKRNFKLWLTSTQVLEKVLHNAEICKTEFEIDRIRRKLPLFVQNSAFPRAVALLEAERIAIISGAPGIGKTTLAEMILYAHLAQGFEPVVVTADIEEAQRLFRPEARQIFYFDDFLGQTFLGDRPEYFGRNQDVAIVDFMEMVKTSAHSRFILTTREHIFRGALTFSERLSRSPVRGYHCVLELLDYSFGQKAQILYNHLYFSDLPSAYKQELLQDDFFLEIVRHPHFNPRIIEWLSGHARAKVVPSGSYRSHVASLLASPEQIWAHAYLNQISNAARSFLMVLYLAGGFVRVVDAEPLFASLHRYRSTKYNYSTAPRDFRNCLSELDGGFVTYQSGNAAFINPSIREFVASMILDDSETIDDLFRSAVRNKQIAALSRLANINPSSRLGEYFSNCLDVIRDSMLRLIDVPVTRSHRSGGGSSSVVHVDIELTSRITLLMEIATSAKSLEFVALASKTVDRLIAQWDRNIPNFPEVLELLEAVSKNAWFLEAGGRELYTRLLNALLAQLEWAYASDWLVLLPFSETAYDWSDLHEKQLAEALETYISKGVRDEVRDCDDLDQMIELREALQQLSTKYGLSLGLPLRRLEDEIAEREEPEPDYDSEWGRGGSFRSSSDQRSTISDDDIREMFGTLKEGQ